MRNILALQDVGLDMRLGLSVFLVALAATALLALSCGDADQPTPSSTATTTPTASTAAETTPTPPAGSAWPKDKRTGDSAVDALLDAIYSGDAARVQALFQLFPVPCANEDRYSGPIIVPPCGQSPLGTPVDAFPTSGCTSGWASSTFPLVDSLLMRDPRLYAVFRQAPRAASPPDGLPAGSLVVVFATSVDGRPDPRSGGIALELERGLAVAETSPCGPFPKFFEGVTDGAFLLKPQGGLPVPSPTQAPRLSGDVSVDRFIRALVDGDWQTLADSFALYPEPCAVEPQGVGSPAPCPTGVPGGSTIQGARLMACERAYITDPDRDFPGLLRPIFAFPHQLYAVYRTDGGFAYNWVPRGDTAIVIGEGDGGLVSGQVWFVEDGKLVGALFGCGQSPEELVEDVAAAAFILPPPPAPPKPTPTPTPAPDSTGYPPHWRTGEPWVDMVLQAFFSENPPRLAAHFQLYPVGCISGPGGFPAPPRCADGQTEGTPVEVFPVLLTEGIYVIRDGTTAIAEQMTANSPRLYAVYRQQPQPAAEGTFPRGEYVVIFNAGGRGMALQVSGGNILSVWFSSGQTAAEMAALAPPGSFILPPPP